MLFVPLQYQLKIKVMDKIYLVNVRMEIVRENKTYIDSGTIPCATKEIAIRVAQEQGEKCRQEMLKFMKEEDLVETWDYINFDNDFMCYIRHKKDNSLLDIQTEEKTIINK